METVMEEEEEYLSQGELEYNQESDITQLCRVCANPNEYLIPIFQGEGLEHDLKDKIKEHLPIKVTQNDKLPKNLCYQCASTLIAWHDMVIGCLEADAKLKSLIEDDLSQTGESEVFENTSVNDTESQNIKYEENQTVVAAVSSQDTEKGYEFKPNVVFGAERVAMEEEVTSLEPEITEETILDEREAIVKTEDLPQVVSFEVGEDGLTAVEVYEDVETSVVVQDIVEDFEGQYFYIDDQYVESSVEVINHEMAENNDSSESFKEFICDNCGKIFTDLESFKTHLTLHQSRVHLCNYCDATYKRIDHLYKHIEIMHPDSSIALAPKEKKVNPYAKTFLCNTCGKILKSSIAYENHTLKHQSKCPFPCSVCSETFPNRGARRRHEVREHNLLTKENGNPDGYHVCDVCGLEMFSDGAYYHHKDKHGDPYPCGFCGKLYGSRSLMQVHARRHTTERPFVCTICNRNFKVKQELNAHLNIHRDIRPYQCPHCPKMCRKSSDLTHHIRTHTGEKPFICDKCGRGFAQAGDMRKHRQLHFRPSKLNKQINVIT